MIEKIASYIPGIQDPAERLSFKKRLMWTGLVIAVYLILGNIRLYGVDPASVGRFEILEMILGSTFGTILTLGIGPIVTASIILQLLVGSGIIEWDLKNPDEREKFTSAQKILTVVLSFVEAAAYVLLGGLAPVEWSAWLVAFLIFQVSFGGIVVMYLDEIMQKWGIGSGISMFIALGVSKTIFVRLLSPFTLEGGEQRIGIIYNLMNYLTEGNIGGIFTLLVPVLATAVVFLIVVYAQDVQVEVPLAFGSISGFARRWPLKFIYTSNMPVILLAALMANLRLLAQMLSSKGIHWLGMVDENGQITGGLLYYLTPPNSLQIQIIMLTAGSFLVGYFLYSLLYRKSPKMSLMSMVISLLVGVVAGTGLSIYTGAGLPLVDDIVRSATYLVFFMAGSAVFSWMWVITSGMDAESVAKQIESIGMQIPGFRRDSRIIEKVLDRYIGPLTIMGGLFVGFLAAFADFTNALGTGTGILLTVMIVFNFYEQIMYQYLQDMDPRLRKFFKGK